MSLFSLGKKVQTVVTLDISSSSIGGAYVRLTPGKLPLVVYSTRLPLVSNATEPLRETLPRTLALLLTELTGKGGSQMHALAGSGAVDRVFVSLTAPWVSASVRRRTKEEAKPFTFTHAEFNAMMAEHEKAPPGFTQMNDVVIATLLNGYELADPFGKKVTRAELFVLSSMVEDEVLALVRPALRKAFHTRHIDFASFMSEAYLSLTELYPHQRDFMLINVTNESTDTILVKHGLLANIASLPTGVAKLIRESKSLGLSSPTIPTIEAVPHAILDVSHNQKFAERVNEAEEAWLAIMKEALEAQAKVEPLPRTVFLLAEEPVRDFLRRLLDSPVLRSLWLTDETLSPIALSGQQFLASVEAKSPESLQPATALLALASKRRYQGS